MSVISHINRQSDGMDLMQFVSAHNGFATPGITHNLNALQRALLAIFWTCAAGHIGRYVHTQTFPSHPSMIGKLTIIN